MMLAVTIIMTLTLVFYITKYRQKRKRLVEQVNKFDGPKTLPLLGNLHYFFRSPIEMLRTFPVWLKEYRSPFRLWMVNEPLIVLTKPEDIKALSSQHLEKDYYYSFLSDLIGDGLITCNVTKWKRRRPIVHRAFNTAVWSRYFLKVFEQQNLKLTQKFDIEAKKGEYFDVGPYMINSAFSTICHVSMGYNFEEEQNNTLGDIYSSQEIFFQASKLACKRCYQPWLHPSFIFKAYTYLIGCSDVFQLSKDLPRKIIKKEKQRMMEQKEVNKKNELDTDDNISMNLLEIILREQEQNNRFTEEELTDEILTVIFAGTETTALVNSFTLLMLAMHPQIQEKVYEELDQLFGNTGRSCTLEDLHRMKFLEQCLKETMRLFSTVPMIHREIHQDVLISGDQVIPGGTRVVICSYAVHHDEKYYPEPDKWNPHNFDPDKTASRHPFAFIPFGTGPRTCLGNKYSMLSMKSRTSTVIRNFKLTTDVKMEDIVLNYDFVIRSEHGYRIKLEYRG